MIKYGLVILILCSVLLLGLTNTGFLAGPGRDPVPSAQKVAHSNHCAGCHGYDETGLALVDGNGNDVNIFDDWQVSMMGLAAHDPFWRATVAHETSQYPTAKGAIETTCLKCHSPLGSIQAHLDQTMYSFERMLTDSLGLDGVSCGACHQQPAEDLGKAFSGEYSIDTNRVFFGPYPNPFQGPMQIYVGFDPVFSDHIYSSGICAGCHTLITETLNEDGTPSGDFFVEQATYHEWLNSTYPNQGKECQTCHMPFIADSVVIATDYLVLEGRYPYGLHQFFGANTAMLDMMKKNKTLLGLPSAPSDLAWDESIENNRISLSKAADLTLDALRLENDTLYLELTIQNKAGHKMPSGYPSRLSWVQIALEDQINQVLLYTNGSLDNEGHISGRDLPYEPHHEVSKSAEDVQIYELVMSDLQGQLTTRLNAAYRPLKDNRLLPKGFSNAHQAYDTIAVWGNATLDSDYGIHSNLGLDKIEYRIPLDGQEGIADLDISLRYHTLPSRWMNDLFSHDSVPEVALFKSLYEGYESFNEIIDHVRIEGIDLSTSSIRPLLSVHSFDLFPNPVTGSRVQVRMSDLFPSSEKFRFAILDLSGKKLQSGILSNVIELNTPVPPGVFYFLLYQESRLIAVKPFTVL